MNGLDYRGHVTQAKEIHVVLGNLSAHKTKDVDRFLSQEE